MNPIRTFLSADTEAAARGRLALCSALFAGHAGWLACVAEDSYISFRFAHRPTRAFSPSTTWRRWLRC